MVNPKEERLKSFYVELKKIVDNQKNYSKVIKVCNKILSESDQDIKAWQCKLTAQIHLEDFAGGLRSLRNCKVLEHLLFEKAYCEYRLNEIEEAWNTIGAAPANSPLRIRELQAQVLYRLERFEECFAKYREIIKNTSDQFDEERLTNLSAVSVNRIYEGSTERGPNFGSDASYEHLYNGACELLSLGNSQPSQKISFTQQALKQLQKAESVCRATLAQDGSSEDEIKEEVAVIQVQQGHCLQLLNREKEALSLYNTVLKTKPDDPALLAVISSNIISINKGANVFDSKKRIRTATVPGLEHKLFKRQRAAIALNQCLFAFATNQDDAVLQESNSILENYGEQRLPATLVKAALLNKIGRHNEAVSSLKALAKEHPVHSFQAVLAATQILLLQGSVDSAMQLLNSLSPEYRFSNGVISAFLVLCSAGDKIDNALKTLQQAIDWHKKSESRPAVLTSFLKRATDFQLRHGKPKAAVESLLELRKLLPSDRNVLARLISAYSQFDTEMAQSLSQELPEPSSIVASIDAEALEASFASKYSRKPVKDASDLSPTSPVGAKKGGDISSEVKERRKERKKKRRKIRLPKNYVAGEQSDPDRWLPRWQRKAFRKRRDRRNKDVMKGTQGTTSDAADKFDITKTAGQHKSSSHGVQSPKPESGGYKRNLQKGKKGKKKK